MKLKEILYSDRTKLSLTGYCQAGRYIARALEPTAPPRVLSLDEKDAEELLCWPLTQGLNVLDSLFYLLQDEYERRRGLTPRDRLIVI